ncbi:MAG: adenylate kinase [Spirochaetaceae bacterium]|nr:adenylate kinase [Spirochaetaceae bacterium]
MKLIFLGPPGAGKGTIADLAVAQLGVPHISTGDLFRAAVKNGTELGLKVKGIMASGGLVPDELTIALVRERLSAGDAAKGWILDGFPRTIPQAEALEKIAGADKVVNFEASDEVVVGRLAGRRVCRSCGKIYHEKNMPPKRLGVCDVDGGELYTRDDDQEGAIRVRLETYRKQTAPLIDWYGRRGSLLTIDGVGAPDLVLMRFKEAMAKA